MLDGEILEKIFDQDEVENELADTLVRNDIHSEYIARIDLYLGKLRKKLVRHVL